MTGNSFINRLRGKGSDPAVPPVIIIGSHRSGTSLVADCLQKAGLFTGADLDPNGESKFFIELNDWMLNQAGCRWDMPEAFHGFLDQPELDGLVAEQMKRMMAAPAAYLGRKVKKGLTDMQNPWGWKDPRNTLTLPVWMKIFPDARIIHVVRHGVDVAASLSGRSRYVLSRWHAKKKKLLPSDVITDSSRCLTLEGAFSLWTHYLVAARSQTICDGNRIKHVRYEDILEEPGDQLSRLIAFAGLSVSAGKLAGMKNNFRKDRAYAYKRDPHLIAFAKQNRDQLAVNGYRA